MTPEIKPDDLRVSKIIRASRTEYDSERGWFNSHAERELRMALADFIQGARVETREEEHFVEKRLDLYVATPGQFWAIVHKEAERLALRYGAR